MNEQAYFEQFAGDVSQPKPSQYALVWNRSFVDGYYPDAAEAQRLGAELLNEGLISSFSVVPVYPDGGILLPFFSAPRGRRINVTP